MKIIEKGNLNEITEAKIALVDFYADWCGPCKMFAPDFVAASEELAKEDVFCCKVNVDNCEQFAIDNKIQFVPTVILMKEGVEQNRFVGPKKKADVLDFVHKSI